MADSAKLRLIITKLEGKLKPMHNEIESLKERLELATLDKELAEEQVAVAQGELAELKEQLTIAEKQLEESQSSDEIIERLTAKNLELSARITQLSQQVADLELLKDLGDELEETHLQRERELNEHILQLETQVSAAVIKLRAAERQTADLQRALAAPSEPTETAAASSASVDVLRLEQELQTAKLDLQHTKLDLRACRLDLQAAKSDPYAVLALETGNKAFFKLKFLAAAHSEIEIAVQKLFDGYKYQEITIECAESAANDLAQRPWPPIDRFWPQALTYLRDLGATVPDRPEMSSLAAALDDPQLKVEIAPEMAAPSKPLATPASPRATAEDDEMRIKIKLLEAKVGKARDLAAHVARLESQLTDNTRETARLKAEIYAQQQEIQGKTRRIEELSERPVSLDALTSSTRISVLNATVEYLMKGRQALTSFSPLEFEPRRFSALAGHPAIRELIAVAGDFRVREINPRKWRPNSEKPGWVASEQARALARVGALARPSS